MAQITAIDTQIRHPDRFSLFVDGVFFHGVGKEVVALLRLQVGQSVNPSDLKKILEREEDVRAREYCLRWLEMAPRTRRQLADRLTRKGVEPDTAQRVLDRLQNTGLVNDEAFARNWVKTRSRQGALGRRRLQAELAQRGVDRDTTNRVVQEEAPEDETLACEQLARRKAPLYLKVDRETARRRMAGFLARRGFQSAAVFRAVNLALPLEHDEGET